MKFIFVFLGGGLGSIARYGLYLIFARTIVNFPIATLLSNLLSTLIFALISVYLYKKPEDFNVYYYKRLNEDLTNLTDEELLYHFIHLGIKEKRPYK